MQPFVDLITFPLSKGRGPVASKRTEPHLSVHGVGDSGEPVPSKKTFSLPRLTIPQAEKQIAEVESTTAIEPETVANGVYGGVLWST